MQPLEINLGQELVHRRRAVRNFQGRVVIAHHRDMPPIEGRIVDSSELMSYTLRVPANKLLAFFHKKDNQLGYNTLEKMQLVNPQPEDELRTRIGYHEVTVETVRSVIKWARRYRT